jgi:predicted dehydrogenase
MIYVGLIGCGYWGPNLIRNFMKAKGCDLVAVADQRPERLEAARCLNPAMKTTRSAQEVIESDLIDAVVIATPISTHFGLAKACLQNRKHVFIEKPITRTSAEARELISLARRQNRILMVDHTFIYSGAVRKLREIIDSGDLGDIYYYDSVRLNLGLFQPDVNALWDLAPHDFSVLTHLLRRKVRRVGAAGSSPVCWNGWKRESIVYVTVELEDDTIAHFHLNWLSPVKLRRTLIGGSRKMVVYDHLVPKVDQTEPLEIACQHFVDCIGKGETPITDGAAGLRVVELLEAAEEFMHSEREKEKTQVWKKTPAQISISA